MELPHEVENLEGIVKERKRNADSNLIGRQNPNLLLNSRKYVVDFCDGNYGEYTANTIIDNIYKQINDDGTSNILLKVIIDYRCNDDAIPKERGWITLPSGIKKR